MQLENLIRAGAFDALEANRARLFAAAEAILRRAQANGGGKGERPDRAVRCRARRLEREALRLPDMPDWPPMERLELRGRGDRLPSHRASARRLCQGVAPARHDAVRAGRNERAVRRDARAPGRHGGGAEGAGDAHRQPDGVGAHHRCVRFLRGHAVRRGAVARARSAGQRDAACWSPPICARTARHCGSPRRMCRHSIRPPPMPVPRCASGCARRPRCRTSAICSGARGAARGG